MRQSHLFAPLRRELPKEEESKNAILLIRGGYIDKTMAGVYSYLPLGLGVIQKVMAIVREEMNALPGVQEILMPSLQPRELWLESGRWEDLSDIMYRVAEDSMGLGPTHEEIVTDVFRRHVSSYKQLPLAVYQIQTKFRNEPRAKSGLLRGREFIMKDLYSFHTTEAGLIQFYDKVKEAYRLIFSRCGLEPLVAMASGGIYSKFSEEFQLVNEAGEDTIYLNEAKDYGRNKEIVPNLNDEEFRQFAGKEAISARSIEVGNIFKLNRKFSEPMQALVSSENGELNAVWMGCYGLGISRLVGSLVEAVGDVEKGLISWPIAVAPFKIHLIDLTQDAQGEPIYAALQKAGLEVLFDDRLLSAGEKFAEADLIGSPYRLVISKRSQAAGGIEYTNKITGFSEVKTLEIILKLLTD